jgi:hypothetical protein
VSIRFTFDRDRRPSHSSPSSSVTDAPSSPTSQPVSASRSAPASRDGGPTSASCPRCRVHCLLITFNRKTAQVALFATRDGCECQTTARLTTEASQPGDWPWNRGTSMPTLTKCACIDPLRGPVPDWKVGAFGPSAPPDFPDSRGVESAGERDFLVRRAQSCRSRVAVQVALG